MSERPLPGPVAGTMPGRRLAAGLAGILLLSLGYTYALIVHQPVHDLFFAYQHSYVVARSLYHFGYPYYPDMTEHDAIVAELRGAIRKREADGGEGGRYGSTTNVLDRWIAAEPVLRKMEPERIYLTRPFLYEWLIAAWWKLIGRETFATFVWLSYVCFNVGLLLLIGYVLRVTGSLGAAAVVAALTWLYAPYEQLTRPTGLHMLVFPLSIGAAILVHAYLRSRTALARALCSLGIGALIGTVILTRTDELFWLPILGLLWASLTVRDWLGEGWRASAARLVHFGLVLAVVYATVLPLLRFHERHTGERFLGLGGYISLVVGWRLHPDNAIGPPTTAADLIPLLKAKGYYGGNEEWEPGDLRNSPQSFDLDRGAKHYALEVLRDHPVAVLIEVARRAGYLLVPFAYRDVHFGFWLASPPVFVWRLVEPVAGGIYLPADTFDGLRRERGGGIVGLVLEYLKEHPVLSLVRVYAYLIAPLLACLGGAAALLTLWNPIRHAEFAIGLWYLAKALFTLAVIPLGNPYLFVTYAAAFGACVLAVRAWQASRATVPLSANARER